MNVLPFALFLYSAKSQEAQSPHSVEHSSRDICNGRLLLRFFHLVELFDHLAHPF